jgi:hypothetical protein
MVTYRQSLRLESLLARREDVVELSLVDTEIINAFQRIPWDAQLWFPVVQRKFLNIGADATDEQIHAAFVSLIEKQVVISPACQTHRKSRPRTMLLILALGGGPPTNGWTKYPWSRWV